MLPPSVIGTSFCVLTLIKLMGKLYGLPQNFHSPGAAEISNGGAVGVDSPVPKSKFNCNRSGYCSLSHMKKYALPRLILIGLVSVYSSHPLL